MSCSQQWYNRELPGLPSFAYFALGLGHAVAASEWAGAFSRAFHTQDNHDIDRMVCFSLVLCVESDTSGAYIFSLSFSNGVIMEGIFPAGVSLNSGPWINSL